jgi:DNA-binding MarR family transcriptional regulator
MQNAKTARRRDNSTDPEGEFPLGPREYFFYLIYQSARQRDLFFDRELAPTGLDLAQWRSLAIIRRLETCTMKALARFSTVERTTLTRAVDHLVGRNLVARTVPSHDRRQVHLALTDLGEDVYIQAVKILKDHNAAMLTGVDADLLRDATRLMQLMLHRLTGGDELTTDLVNFGRRALEIEV